MAGNYPKQLYNDYLNKCAEVEHLSAVNRSLSTTLSVEKAEHVLTTKKAERYEQLYLELEKSNKEKSNRIKELENEVQRLSALINTDGTNSGLPTSKTPLSKEKVRPNSREKSNRHIGGQPGHEKHNLKPFDDDKVTETQDHIPEHCPDCGDSDLIPTGRIIIKDETEYRFLPVRIRHRFIECRCPKCGEVVLVPIPNNLKEANQYGPHVQALCLTLMNIGNVPINKVKRIVSGLSEDEINLSEGYIAKLQKRAAGQLDSFLESLKDRVIRKPIIHWDDTVIDISTNRACLRYYGDDKAALYFAHTKKDKAGIDEDGILSALPSSTKVVHDHNRVNYNPDYGFTNVECCAHLLRDLEKCSQNSQHEWAGKMKHLFTETNCDRNDAIEKGEEAFSNERTKQFFLKFDDLMEEAIQQNKADPNRYFSKEENALIRRLIEYKDNYCMFVVDFDVPFTNNEAERSLRIAKSKMKVSGQFQNLKSAEYYAALRSYIETCRRNGINETVALERLCCGEPYTIEEIMTEKDAE